MKEIDKVCSFLQNNGWVKEEEEFPSMVDAEFQSFHKKNCLSVDVSDSEIVILDDSGDLNHLPLNIYALIGCLIDRKSLSANYSSYL